MSDPGYPAPEFRWWRAHIPGRVIYTSPNPTFTISQARLADNGNYTCQASNEIGVGAPSTVTVEVNCENHTNFNPFKFNSIASKVLGALNHYKAISMVTR
ncbi:hypothetical protein DPMN_128247 [Dreissena polymorpha]|uniref:Ig-like domain-containing protein n=1 Tax=Dreissena polymorpha TaxID=45954 RepID=A0A9D4H0S8_DREPO|nr:hypothetical protein DPMN_128247 [Dreissena polymorpha]